MKLFALVSARSSQAVDLYVRRIDAEQDIAAVASDDAALADELTILELNFTKLYLAGARFSPN